MKEPVVRFRREVYLTRLLDPRRGYCPVEIPSEVRYDPLTGETGRIAHFLSDWVPALDLEQWRSIMQVENCPFCPENAERVTPRFPEELVPGGCLRRGEAITFPNLSPYDQFSAVTVICGAHFPLLDEFSAVQIFDAFRLSLDFLARIQQTQPRLYPFIGWNYLPPAGSSQLHPHLQVFATAEPGNEIRRELEAEASYRRQSGCSFWRDLVEAEKQAGERYLGQIGETEWLVAFRPHGALGEVIALLPEGQVLPLISEGALYDLAQGLTCLFRSMQASHLLSFDAVLYRGLEGTRLRLAPRFYIHPRLYTSDVNFLKLLCGEPIAVVAPEELARRLQPVFRQAAGT
ncbi:MAG: hypothetical protein ACPLPT_05625 [Moorellales bacterium]